MRNLPLTFDYSTYSRKLGEDFAKFCGLLRIYELYECAFCGDALISIYVSSAVNDNFITKAEH